MSLGQPCDEHGVPLLPGTPPLPRNPNLSRNDWTPFDDRVQFELSEFLFTKVEMSQTNVNTLMELWAASLVAHDGHPPFSGYEDMHAAIDSIPHGDVPWESFSVRPSGDITEDAPSWMHGEYDVWFRNPREVVKVMLDNPDFSGEIDAGPYRDFDAQGHRVLKDFMSGDWSWRQAVRLLCLRLSVYSFLVGQTCGGSRKRWHRFRARHFGQRQDHCIGGHRTE